MRKMGVRGVSVRMLRRQTGEGMEVGGGGGGGGCRQGKSLVGGEGRG